jgi:hypothetical protein
MITIRRDSDLIKLLHEAVSFIHANMQSKKLIGYEDDFIIDRIFKELNKETIYYDSKSLDFKNFIAAVKKDTAHWWLLGSKINKPEQAKTILVKIMSAIRNIITRKAVPKKLEQFIKEEHGYDISNKDSVNLLNFLINFKFYHDLSTHDFMSAIYPELAEKITWKSVPNPPNIINAKPNTVPPKLHWNVPKPNFTRKNVEKPKPREEKKEEKKEEREKREEKKEEREKREEKKEEREKREEKKEEEKKNEYPFGAKAQRRTRRNRL